MADIHLLALVGEKAVASILTCYYRAKPGGFCARLFRTIRALLAAGHTVHYLSVTPFPIDHPRCVHHRFPWPAARTDSMLFWAFFYLAAPALLLWIALRRRVSHAFAFSAPYAFLMLPARCINALRFICFIRGDALLAHADKGRQPWVIRSDRLLEGIALYRAHVVVVTPHLIDAIRGRQGRAAPSRFDILPNDLPAVRTRSTKQVGQPLRLAMVGILEPSKNQGYVIELLAALKVHDWRLAIFGVGPELDRLSARTQACGLAARTLFPGWCAAEQIWPNIDLLLAPSLHEGMPNAVLEAVAYKVPVLASDIPAHRGILPADQVLPLDRPKRWIQTITAILHDPAPHLQRMAHQQHQCSRHLAFNWDDRVVELIIASANDAER